MGPVLWLQPNYGGGALPAPLFALRGGLAREPVAQLPRPGAGGHERPPEPSFDLCEGVVFLFLCRRFLGCLRRARVLGLVRLARRGGGQGLLVGLSGSLREPVRLWPRREPPGRLSLKGFEKRDDFVVDLVCLLDEDQVSGVVYAA